MQVERKQKILPGYVIFLPGYVTFLQKIITGQRDKEIEGDGQKKQMYLRCRVL